MPHRNRRNAQLYWLKKNACWIWIAVDRYAKEFVNFTIGDRSTKTGKELWKGVKDRAKGFIATDYWGPYKKFIPKDKHIQSKAHTYTVEGYNSLFRHFLARMRRKSKCYSKSKEMLEYSVKLLILKRNGMLDILN